jgi:hypothetical protein
MARTPDPNSKAGFVRSFPLSTPGDEVVSKAKAKGIAIDVKYVYAIRSRLKTGKRAGKLSQSPTTGLAPTRAPTRGSGRAALARRPASSDGLTAEIERIVEARVSALLKERLGALLDR